ncbi:LacI family DNA-binding transcriptional regulator [Herbidospora cretacea]|uniref:LacI family DNA-binding transcriptional regulator n=1 Tax=Herbidospora cretacea TaxID=28444 RepID=UPI000772E5B9|nr:LacI family DNA-binding transcriptional regulator [Herbidospora cretacea]
MGNQVTMSDIARRAGVSRATVSYALNGRPGVSEEVRERILRIASEVDFRSSVPAKALRGAGTHAIGMTLRRRGATVTIEAVRRRLISGIQSELAVHGFGLVLQFVDEGAQEMEVYRLWRAEGRVDGVIVCDPQIGDPRPTALADMEMPTVVLGQPEHDEGPPHVWTDPVRASESVISHLAALGHRHIARIGGPETRSDPFYAVETFSAVCAGAGITATVVMAAQGAREGVRSTRRLLVTRPRPTAIVYDSDIMAVAGLGVAKELGLRVPAELSILAWDDSVLCGLVRPAITALSRDAVADGGRAVQLLLRDIAGERPAHVEVPVPYLVVRDSTGRLDD